MFEAADEFQKLCDKKQKNEILVIQLIWPCGNDLGIVKAFFDHKHPLNLAGNDTTAFVPTPDSSKFETEPVTDGSLTVEGELNKLASNIAIGRDWAGVRYFTDYIESLRMGEKIAVGILEEQKLTYCENFYMRAP